MRKPEAMPGSDDVPLVQTIGTRKMTSELSSPVMSGTSIVPCRANLLIEIAEYSFTSFVSATSNTICLFPEK